MTDQTIKSVQITTAEWLSLIAAKAETNEDAVGEILAKHGIEAQSVIPHRRTITLTSIKLAGTKSGMIENAFEVPETPLFFDWKDLGPGLWVVSSDANSKGKSSILNAFKAAVKGKFPGSIKSDVWRWLAELEVGFKLDDILHRVVVTKPAGSVAARVDGGFHACLERQERSSWIALHSVDDAESFEIAMSDFFMQELGFEKFHAYRTATDTKRTHGWPSMASALFISGAGPSLFGEEVVDGLSIRLLQLFIGLPWISTYSAINICVKQIEAESARISDVSARARSGIVAEIAELKRQKEALLRERAELPDRSEIHRRQREDDRRLAVVREERLRSLGSLSRLEEEFAAASSGYNAARNLRQQIEDEISAGHVFRRLHPRTCPSCDAVVPASRAEHGTCFLCGEKEEPSSDEASARIDTLKEDEKEAKKAKDGVDLEIDKTRARLDDLDQEIAELEVRIRGAESALIEAHKSAEVDGKILALAGGIEALERALPPESKKDSGPDARILKAALDVTQTSFQGMQQTVLDHFSKRLHEIASKIGVVGVEHLKYVNVKTNRIDIVQGNTPLTFGKLNSGEQLRFRIAAALAAVETANWSGAGRHPGLIVLDSPAAHEMSSDDFGAILTGLQTILKDQPDIQIIVGALMRPQISAAVSCEHMKYAHDEDNLF